MRERNNEASKRCRLKRRLKAESIEGQAVKLLMSNKMLKQRISRLEKVGLALKDGVKRIKSNKCVCLETAATVKKANSECEDSSGLSNKVLLESSKLYRNNSFEAGDAMTKSGGPLLSSSDDEATRPSQPMASPLMPEPVPEPIPTPPTVPRCVPNLVFPGRSELSVTKIVKTQPTVQQQQQTKTALDVLNDTIVKSLAVNKPQHHLPTPTMPLNLVKIVPRQAHQVILLAPPAANQKQQQKPLHTPTPTPPPPSSSGVPATIKEEVKHEPDVQIVERTLAPKKEEDVRSCIAISHGSGCCSGELHSINKLNSYLDLLTRKVSGDNGKAAMERAIIKSRLRIPFWKADEVRREEEEHIALKRDRF